MRADHEPNPLKCVTQEEIDLIFAQILRIPDEIRRINEQVKPSLAQKAMAAVSKKKTPEVEAQEKADALVAKAIEIYSRTTELKIHLASNPDLWQHEEKQKNKAAGVTQTHVMIAHDQAFMKDVRPIANIDALNKEIANLQKISHRTEVQNKKLALLEKQRKLFQFENRIVPESEIDHYAELAKKYAELLSLLDNAFDKGRAEKSKTVIKENSTLFGKEKRREVKQLPELSEFIQYLNDNPDKDHYSRMVSAILKEKFSDEKRHLFTGIMFHDTTGVYNHSAFARRGPFKDLVVPDTYQLMLENKNEGKELKY